MAERPPAGRWAVPSWILYDMANTLFSFSILSAFYPVWLSQDIGLPDAAFAAASSTAMLLMLVLSPVLGALSDRSARRVPSLAASTLLCVAATAPLGLVPWPVSLALFVVATVGFQAGTVFYDALLPAVSTPATRGRTGSLGVALGYLGSLAGLGLGTLVLAGHEDRDAWVFAAVAGAMLLLASPAFVAIREPARAAAGSVRDAVVGSLRSLGRLLRGREDRRLGRFLLGRALYTDAANTMVAFMGIYAVREAGLDDAGVRLTLLAGIAGAFLAAPAWGFMADRRGPARTLVAVLWTWLAALAAVVAVPLLGLPAATFHAVAFLLGAALGGTWTADRPLLLQLAPPGRVGEAYGWYGMVGRFSAVLGPLAWALVVDGLGWGRLAAVTALAAATLAGLLVVRPLAAGRPSLPAAG